MGASHGSPLLSGQDFPTLAIGPIGWATRAVDSKGTLGSNPIVATPCQAVKSQLAGGPKGDWKRAMDDSLARLRYMAAQRLESLQRAGVEQLPRPKCPQPPPSTVSSVSQTRQPEHSANTEQEASSTMTSTKKKAALSPPLVEAPEPSSDILSSASSLEILAQEVADCTLCTELAETRKQTVFGVGNPAARLCFMGEAPGASEDQQGEPFVGRAGKLLDKILVACGMRREDVYILNVLKCRPPGNRNPTPTESQSCRRFLNRQLELIEPNFICCLGAVAAQNLLDTTESIGHLRGRVHQYRGIKVVCTYHPAYLLRNPAAKKPTWEDMQLLLGEMGLEIPSQ